MFVIIVHFKFLLILNDDVNDTRIVFLDNCNPLLLLRKIFLSLIFFLVDLYHRSLRHDLQYYLLFYFNLSHHTCFFMFKNVTVVHISTLLIKLNYKSYFFVRLNIYSIFPSALLWRRRITVS